jgi:NAD kinase
MGARIEINGLVLEIGSFYRVIDGFHTGHVGALMGVEEGNFGRRFAELVVDERTVIRCRLEDLVNE